MGQKTSRELPTASPEELLKTKKESKDGSHPQPLPKFPESLQMQTPLPSLHLPSKTNEGMQEPTPPEALKKPFSQLLQGSSTTNKEWDELPRATMDSNSKINEDLKDATEIWKEPKEEMLKKSKTKRYEDEIVDRQNRPHRYEDILKEAGRPLISSVEQKLREGIYLNNHTKRYWIDVHGYNCFMLFARALQITWIEDEQFWSWFTVQENDIDIEVARLLDVCWLEIHGRLDISYLNPGVTYEVVFLVMREPGYGWTVPVNLRLKLPQGVTQLHTEDLQVKALWYWIELKAGEFTVDAKMASGESEMEFSLFDYKGGQWKHGLVVKGAIIRPKT